MTVQVLDLHEYTTPEQLATPLLKQASKLGFVFIRGVDEVVQQASALFQISERFFHEEQEATKRAHAINTANVGYAAFKQESLDPSKPGDEKEVFNFALIDHGEPRQALPPLLAQHVAELEAFQRAGHALVLQLLEAVAVALGLPSTTFQEQHAYIADNPTILRFLRYPAGSVSRAGSHSDYGTITLLFQKQVGGLQVLPPQESPSNEAGWVDVPVMEDAVLVNVGDALEFMTGSKLASTLHRVTSPPAGEPIERFSIAMFVHAVNSAPLKSVLPHSSLDVSPVQLERMERKGVKRNQLVTAGEHLQARLAATYSGRAATEPTIS